MRGCLLRFPELATMERGLFDAIWRQQTRKIDEEKEAKKSQEEGGSAALAKTGVSASQASPPPPPIVIPLSVRALSALREFFGVEPVMKSFPNCQQFDFVSVAGRLLSSSYIPEAGPRHGEMMEALKELFDTHQKDGRVTFEYDTVVYFGRVV